MITEWNHGSHNTQNGGWMDFHMGMGGTYIVLKVCNIGFVLLIGIQILNGAHMTFQGCNIVFCSFFHIILKNIGEANHIKSDRFRCSERS